MNLKKYIQEAISSGRMRSRSAEAMPESLQLKDIMSWLENIDVPMLSSPSKFKINYFFTNNGQNFVVLFPETKQHSEIGFIFKISPSGFTYPMRMEEEGESPTHYNGGDRSQNEMFFYKIYSLATNGSINEAISSKQNSLPFDPDLNEPEKITDWLEGLGFKRVSRIPAKISKSKPDYSIAPAKLGQGMNIELKFIGKDNRTYWGNFKTGSFTRTYGGYFKTSSFTYARLLDITDDRNPFPVFTGWNDNQDEVTKNIIEFIDENV